MPNATSANAKKDLGAIAELIGASVPAHPQVPIGGIASLTDARESDISFYTSDRYQEQFQSTRAAAVIVTRGVDVSRPPANSSCQLLIVDNADAAMVITLRHFAPAQDRPEPGIHPTAIIAATASIGAHASIGPHVVIGERSVLGDDTIIHAGVYIGSDVTLGKRCELYPRVVIRERVRIGEHVTIHAGSVIGTDGFGYRWTGKFHEKIPQIGEVVIEDDVEIGSCTCIDRAKFLTTRIGRGTKIDNLVQIAHNAILGPHCMIAGQAGVAGSTNLVAGVVMGGHSAVNDHLTVGQGVIVAGGSIIYDDQPAGAVVSGYPAGPHRQTMREQIAVKKLPDLRKQVQQLQRQVEELQKRIDGTDDKTADGSTLDPSV